MFQLLRHWCKMQTYYTVMFCRSKSPIYLNSLVNVIDTESSYSLWSIDSRIVAVLFMYYILSLILQ